MKHGRSDAPWNPPRGGKDATGLFALVVASPILLPALGASLTDFVFLLPLVACALAATRCAAAAGRAREHRNVWLAFGAGTALAAAAS